MEVKTKNNSIGLCGILTIIFIVLKLVGVINWSWFWVLSPIIFNIALTILLLIIGMIIYKTAFYK